METLDKFRTKKDAEKLQRLEKIFLLFEENHKIEGKLF